MTLNSRDLLLALNSAISIYYNATALSPTCVDIYNDFVECKLKIIKDLGKIKIIHITGSDTTGCSSAQSSVAFDYQVWFIS